MSQCSRLLFRGEPRALTFDGNPLSLNQFFSDINEILQISGLMVSDVEKVAKVKYYVDGDVWRLWDSLRLMHGVQFSWDKFQKAVQKLYPGLEPDSRLFSVRDLEQFVHEWSRFWRVPSEF
jgi:hypothetical protein